MQLSGLSNAISAHPSSQSQRVNRSNLRPMHGPQCSTTHSQTEKVTPSLPLPGKKGPSIFNPNRSIKLPSPNSHSSVAPFQSIAPRRFEFFGWPQSLFGKFGHHLLRPTAASLFPDRSQVEQREKGRGTAKSGTNWDGLEGTNVCLERQLTKALVS